MYHGISHESLVFSWYKDERVYQENTLSDEMRDSMVYHTSFA